MNHTSAWVDPMQERFDQTAASDAAFRRLMRDHEQEDAKFACDHYEKCECGVNWKEHCLYCQEPKSAHILKTSDGDYPRTTQVEPDAHLPVFAAMLAGGAVLAWLAVRRILGRLFP